MDYEIRPLSITEPALIMYSRFLSLVFPKVRKFKPEYLDWQYRQNPFGNAIGFDAWHDSELVGHYATIPVLYNTPDSKRSGLLSLNTAIHPQHQRRGLFRRLALTTFEHARCIGYEYVIGVGNQNSTHGLVYSLGFQFIHRLDVFIGIGWVETILDEQVDFFADRSAAILKWRLSAPNQHYLQTNKGIIAATTYCGVQSILSSHRIQQEDGTAINRAPFRCRVWLGLSPRTRRHGLFLPLPLGLRPSPLNFTYKKLVNHAPDVKHQSLFFEALDFDAF